MALESATYLNSLDPTWPVTGDQLAQGDDHIRLLKAVLKATFAGLAGPLGRVVAKSGDFTPALTENWCTFVPTAALTATLPVLSGCPDGTVFRFLAQGYAITVAAGSGNTVEGAASVVLAAGSNALLVKQSSTQWALVRGYVPSDPHFPSGTRLLFAQASAPTGWTQVTDDYATNRMLRVVAGTGYGIGGSHSPILNNVVPVHTHSITTGTESADHTHSGSTGTESASHTHFMFGKWGGYVSSSTVTRITENNVTTTSSRDSESSSYSTGTESANHTHGFTTGGRSAAHTHSGTTDSGSSATNWTPRYLDLILCSKN